MIITYFFCVYKESVLAFYLLKGHYVNNYLKGEVVSLFNKEKKKEEELLGLAKTLVSCALVPAGLYATLWLYPIPSGVLEYMMSEATFSASTVKMGSFIGGSIISLATISAVGYGLKKVGDFGLGAIFENTGKAKKSSRRPQPKKVVRNVSTPNNKTAPKGNNLTRRKLPINEHLCKREREQKKTTDNNAPAPVDNKISLEKRAENIHKELQVAIKRVKQSRAANRIEDVHKNEAVVKRTWSELSVVRKDIEKRDEAAAKKAKELSQLVRKSQVRSIKKIKDDEVKKKSIERVRFRSKRNVLNYNDIKLFVK